MAEPDGYEDPLDSHKKGDEVEQGIDLGDTQPLILLGIPELNEHGLLPAGIHVCGFDQVKAIFGSSTPRRVELWEKLIRAVEKIRSIGLITSIYMDGSFTTSKPDPGDIDIVLELPPPSPQIQALIRTLDSSVLNIFDQDFMKQNYDLDVWPWNPSVPPNTPYDLIYFFQTIRPALAQHIGVGPEFRKGILRIMI